MTRTLKVQPVCAKLKKDQDFFGKMDPYCQVHIGSQAKKTKVAKDGGKTPVWNDELFFDLNGSETVVNFHIFDRDLMSKNDHLCEGTFPIANIMNGGQNNLQLFRKGKVWGTLTVNF